MDLKKSQREAILSRIKSLVNEKYYDSAFDALKWQEIVARNRPNVIEASNRVAFEAAVDRMINEVAPRGIGLISASSPITSRNSINASFAIASVRGRSRWIFQDVLPGGVAARAGVLEGDVLISVDGQDADPLHAGLREPEFRMHMDTRITVERGLSAESFALSLITAQPKYKENPYSEPEAISLDTFNEQLPRLKISFFPGRLGIDFANKLDSIFGRQLLDADKLVIDLRGNPGGGIGGLTLMSYLTPERIAIGYSKNRQMTLKKTDPSTLPVFDKVPRSKLAVPALAFKFLGKSSIFLYTEGLGPRTRKRRVAMLVNEHTTGAAEMVAQFAQENQLATIVGTKTPGRLVTRSAYKVGCGYRLVLPIAAYVSAKGVQIEGSGIIPDVHVPWSFEEALARHDNQLCEASRILDAA